jgi:hypothetical protein
VKALCVIAGYLILMILSSAIGIGLAQMILAVLRYWVLAR